MLAILLTVLKVIGIILLCLLLVILVVAGLILFVPIRYKASGYYTDSYQVKASISWLLHFCTVRLALTRNSEPQVIVRILGIPVFNLQKKKSKDAKKDSSGKKSKKKVSETDEANYHMTNPEIVKPPVPHRPGSEEPVSNPEKVAKPDKAKDAWEKPKTEQEPLEDVNQEEIGVVDRLKLLFSKCKRSLKNIKYTFTKICDRIKNIKGNINYYFELFQKESTKQALELCKKELLRIWKNLKPKKFKFNLLLGMEDPATTGQIVGYCAMLYPLHKGNITIVPDFEEQVIEADFALRGRITVYVYLTVAYTILFNKNIRRLKKRLLREDS